MYGYRHIYVYEWLNTWVEEKVLNIKAIMMQRNGGRILQEIIEADLWMLT